MPSCIEEDVNRFLNDYHLYDAIFYKSLSTNDHIWADDSAYHQSGPLIPRESIYFFGANELPEENTVYEINIEWFLNEESYVRSDFRGSRDIATVRYYVGGNRSSRPEVHLTNVYNPYFEGLNSGALMVIGRKNIDNEYVYQGIIIDDEKLLDQFIDFIDIPEGPKWGIVDLKERRDTELVLDLLNILEEMADRLYEMEEGLPSTETTSQKVWELVQENEVLLKDHIKCPGIHQSHNPFNTAISYGAGNLIRWLLQKVEFKLVRFLEKKHYPDIMVNEIRKINDFYPQDWDELKRTLGNALDELINISKSITQSRRARAGRSFEWYIEYLLQTYDLDYNPQAGDRKIDFQIDIGSQTIDLSAKTTLRERWKQVYEDSYFITMDRRIPEGKLDKINEKNIKLILPEEDIGEIDYYKDKDFILSYSQFFDDVGNERI